MLSTTKEIYMEICFWLRENNGATNMSAKTHFDCSIRKIELARSYGRSIGMYQNNVAKKLRKVIAELTEIENILERQLKELIKYNRFQTKRKSVNKFGELVWNPMRPDTSGVANICRELRSTHSLIAEMEGAYRNTVSVELETSKGPIRISIKKCDD